MESFEDCVLKYRRALRTLLWESGVPNNLGVDDDWILERIREIIKKDDPIGDKTYVVEHSPNCPSPYLVRLVGRRRGMIDGLPRGETQDILGYGHTFREAAAEAVKNIPE